MEAIGWALKWESMGALSQKIKIQKLTGQPSSPVEER
jgi:hypothetical protein